MDHVFDSQETTTYEGWLATPSGQVYSRAAIALVDMVLDCRPGWRVLEVGCGLGDNLAHLHQRGMLVHGLEAGPVMARVAAQRLDSQVVVDVGDAHDLPYEDNTFDAVILVNTLELVDRRAQVVAEAARVAMSRLCLVSVNPLSLGGLWWRLRPSEHFLARYKPISLWTLRRLVREVLGPVPQTWAGATLWPGVKVARWPLGELIAVCAAVTPRYRTRPLTLEAHPAAQTARPAHSHGRVTALQRVK